MTSTAEYGLSCDTTPSLQGPTINAWDASRMPGGSSGGAAAVVASGMLPAAHASDGGGSIRIPSSCNGVFAIKPTRGRMPTGPDIGDAWRRFVQEHVITRSVRDSAAMLDATAGEDTGTPVACPQHDRPFLEEVTREPGRLRVAVTTTPFFGSTVHPDCVAALEDAAALLESLGHDVIRAEPVVDAPSLSQAFLTVVAAEARADIEWIGEQLKRAPRSDDVELTTWALGLVGKAASAADYATSVRTLQVAGRTVGRFFTNYDVLVTPTLGAPPFTIGALQPSAAERAMLRVVAGLGLGGVLKAAGLLNETAKKVYGFIPYTPLFNVTGQPAMSVPLHWNAAGLPIGTQLVSRFGDEATLFRVAGQLERARPWAGRIPPLI